MLVLTRKPNESVIIEGGIRVTVLKIEKHGVRLGFEAPKHVSIAREELLVPNQDFRSPNLERATSTK